MATDNDKKMVDIVCNELILKDGMESGALIEFCKERFGIDDAQAGSALEKMFNQKIIRLNENGLLVPRELKTKKSVEDVIVPAPELSPGSAASVYQQIQAGETPKQPERKSRVYDGHVSDVDTIQLEREMIVKHIARLLGVQIKIL